MSLNLFGDLQSANHLAAAKDIQIFSGTRKSRALSYPGDPANGKDQGNPVSQDKSFATGRYNRLQPTPSPTGKARSCERPLSL